MHKITVVDCGPCIKMDLVRARNASMGVSCFQTIFQVLVQEEQLEVDVCHLTYM